MCFEVKLTIPRVPPSYSQIIRMKVKARIQMKILWRAEVRVALGNLTGSSGPLLPKDYEKGFKNVYITQYRKALIRDRDNLIASAKPILDALKYNGLIIDDDMKNICLEDVNQVRATGETLIKTVITITDPEEYEGCPK